MTHDYMADIATYRMAYGEGWEDETVSTFYAMIGQIIPLWKQQNGTWSSQDVHESASELTNRKILISARFPSIFSDPFADDGDDGLFD